MKTGDGDVGYRLATVGFLRDYFVRYRLDPTRANQVPALDEMVYRDYAARLVPRAVGYSIAALDYFFRGQLETVVQSRWDGTAERPHLQVVNRTPEETLRGDFELYYDRADGTRLHLPGWSLNTALGPDETTEFLPLPPLPSDLAPAQPLTLVFRGQLGGEAGAVAVAPVRLGAYLLWIGSNPDVPVEETREILLLAPADLSSPTDYRLFVRADAAGHIRLGPDGRSSSGSDDRYFTYRAFGVAPGDRVTLLAGGWCSTFRWQQLSNVVDGSVAPVTAELVALVEPADLAALFAYTASAPPAVARVLHRFSVDTFSGGPLYTAPVDAIGVNFFGLRLTSEPVPPEPLPPLLPFSSTSEALCTVAGSLLVPR